MAGKKHKEKGDRAERWVVEGLKELGLDAQRIPLSGAAGGEFSGDIRFGIPVQQGRWVGEVKARAGAEGWKTIKDWLGYNQVLFLKEDAQPPLVVMGWEEFKLLVSNILILRNSLLAPDPTQAKLNYLGQGNPLPVDGSPSTPKLPPMKT
jgi:hypothetical protein